MSEQTVTTNSVTPETDTVSTANRIQEAIAAAKAANVGAVKDEAEPGEQAQAANGKETVSEPEAKAAEPLSVKARVKEQAQRLREEARKERDEVAQLRAQVEHDRAQLRAQAEQQSAMERLYRENPEKWLEESKLDLDRVVRARLESRTPDARITALEERLKNEIEQVTNWRKQLEGQAAEWNKQQSESAFTSLALNAEKFPFMSALYEDRPQDLVETAYKVQAHLAKGGREVSQEDIAEFLENQESARYSKVKGRQELGGQSGKQSQAKAAKRTITANSASEVASAPVDTSKLSYQELKKLAIQEARKARAASAVE